MNDQTLAEKAAGGCRASFAALIERHDERIYRLAWRICGTQAQAICGWRRRLTHADEPLRDEIVLAGEFYGLATERECRRKEYGAVERTRTSTSCPTATSTLRVYQFRHDRTICTPGLNRP